MRHKAIEMVCPHILQGREPPPHHRGLLGASAEDTKLMGLWDNQTIVTSSHHNVEDCQIFSNDPKKPQQFL